MRQVYDSLIIRFAARIQAPLLQLYALYVLAHGHYSPGGGFQAGAALAGSYLMPRIAEGMTERGERGLTTQGATTLAIIGVLVFAGTGLLSWVLGGTGFLDYSGLQGLPWPMPSEASTRAIGTLVIETGVTMTVMGVIVMLFDDLISRPRAGV